MAAGAGPIILDPFLCYFGDIATICLTSCSILPNKCKYSKRLKNSKHYNQYNGSGKR